MIHHNRRSYLRFRPFQRWRIRAILPAVRAVTHRYRDPLDQIWLGVADRLGIRITRSSEVFAFWDPGEHTLTLGHQATLDADDCLAQMIFHELCHAITEGPARRRLADWGLRNEDDQDLSREYACLRLQCSLLRPLRLSAALAPTTDHRVFYDRLGTDPMSGDSLDAALARDVQSRFEEDPWSSEVVMGLQASAQVIAAVSPYATAGDLLNLDAL